MSEVEFRTEMKKIRARRDEQRRTSERYVTERRRLGRQRKHFESNYEWTVAG